MKKPTITKNGLKVIASCSYCDKIVIALSKKEAEANMYRHYLYKHEEELL